MNTDKPIKCHIGHRLGGHDTSDDPHRIARDLLLFSIPHYGVLFRCRAEGNAMDLEFAAFFSLLQFLRDNLKGEKVTSVIVHSSVPQFVFAFTGRTSHLQNGDARHQLLTEFSRHFTIQVAYCRTNENVVFGSIADMPSMPIKKTVQVKLDPSEMHKTSFEPIRRGVKL